MRCQTLTNKSYMSANDCISCRRESYTVVIIIYAHVLLLMFYNSDIADALLLFTAVLDNNFNIIVLKFCVESLSDYRILDCREEI